MEGSRTLAMIKPGFGHVVGDILKMLIENNFSIELMIERRLTQNQAYLLYAEHAHAPFFEDLCKYITSDSVFIISLYSPHKDAWAQWRSLMPSIREKYGINMRQNVVHGSDSSESAAVELHWMQMLIH